jgi:hypothetical protein
MEHRAWTGEARAGPRATLPSEQVTVLEELKP